MTDEYTIDDLSEFDESELDKVGVGYSTYQGVDVDGVRIAPGMLVYWRDRDAGLSPGDCPALSDREYITPVRKIYLVDYSWTDGWAVEVGTKAPFGRLSVTDVTPECDASGHLAAMFETFEESENSKYMKWENHYPLSDAPRQMAEGHHNASPVCWYDSAVGDTTHVVGE